jgi:hypothetical protein
MDTLYHKTKNNKKPPKRWFYLFKDVYLTLCLLNIACHPELVSGSLDRDPEISSG